MKHPILILCLFLIIGEITAQQTNSISNENQKTKDSVEQKIYRHHINLRLIGLLSRLNNLPINSIMINYEYRINDYNGLLVEVGDLQNSLGYLRHSINTSNHLRIRLEQRHYYNGPGQILFLGPMAQYDLFGSYADRVVRNTTLRVGGSVGLRMELFRGINMVVKASYGSLIFQGGDHSSHRGNRLVDFDEFDDPLIRNLDFEISIGYSFR